MRPTDIKNDHMRLLNNLTTLQKIYGRDNLSGVINVSKNTWTNRMKEPWTQFSYDDFKAISEYCQIDFIQLMTDNI